MSLGGSEGGDGLLIGPFMDWWDRRTAKRDAKRVRKLEAKSSKQRARRTTGRQQS